MTLYLIGLVGGIIIGMAIERWLEDSRRWRAKERARLGLTGQRPPKAAPLGGEYREYLASATCRGCGARHADRQPGKWWYTEEWCGCAAGDGLPDTRPEFS